MGQHGEVRRATHIETGATVAIKLTPPFNPAAGPGGDSSAKEIEAMRRLRHPHVVRLYDVVRTSLHTALVLECVPGGELFEYLVSRQSLSVRQPPWRP